MVGCPLQIRTYIGTIPPENCRRLNKYRITKNVDDKLACMDWIGSVETQIFPVWRRTISYWACKVAQWPIAGNWKAGKVVEVTISSIILRRDSDSNSALFRNSQLRTFWNFWNRKFPTFEQALRWKYQAGAAVSAETSFTGFRNVSADDVRRLIMASQKSRVHCSFDPMPTSIFEKAIDVLLPILTVRCNASLLIVVSGRFRNVHAITPPLLKKSSLDAAKLKNYRTWHSYRRSLS